MKSFRDFLIFIKVIQIHKNTKDDKRGRGYFEAERFNPYNPLSYVAVLIVFILAILMYGFVEVWEDTKNTNLFKWR